MARTVQALLKASTVEQRQQALETAQALHRELSLSVSVDDFIERAQRFDAGGFSVKVEVLDAVAADGRTANPEKPPRPGARVGFYKRRFAEAAVALTESGAISPLVQTEYGYHTLILRDRLPEQRIPVQDRTARLKSEILDTRAKRLQQDLLAALRQSTPIEIERSAVSAMGLLQAKRLNSP